MGCGASKDIEKGLLHSDHKGIRESSSSSPAVVEMHKKPQMPLAKFRVDALQCEHLSKEWLKSFSITDGGEKVSVDMVLKDSLSLLRTWPRGELAGQFLPKPEFSNTPLKDRGVKLSWLLGAWHHMTANTQRHLISTRMFVELFVRPLLLNEGGERDAPSLYDFIPQAFRSSPTVFVSHPWDGYFRHVLFYPESLKKSWPADSSVWLDFIACSQLDDGPNPDHLISVRETIQAINRTVVVFPGDGTPEFAILPATRSWCIFEMLCTPKEALDFRVGLHGDLNDIDFHSKIVELIDGLTVEKGNSSYSSDKREIEKLLEANGSVQNNTSLRSITRAAFAKRYEGVPTTPNMSHRISNGSRTSRGRMDSMSDIYVVDEVKLEDNKAPDF